MQKTSLTHEHSAIPAKAPNVEGLLRHLNNFVSHVTSKPIITTRESKQLELAVQDLSKKVRVDGLVDDKMRIALLDKLKEIFPRTRITELKNEDPAPALAKIAEEIVCIGILEWEVPSTKVTASKTAKKIVDDGDRELTQEPPRWVM